MIQIGAVLLPAMLGAYCTWVHFTAGTLVIAAFALLAAIAGGVFKRFFLFLVSALLSLANLLALFPEVTPGTGLWVASLYSILVFVSMELGYDWCSVFRDTTRRRVYGRRALYLTVISISSIVVVFLFATLGYNAANLLPSHRFLLLVLPSLALIVATVAAASVTVLRRRSSAETENAEELQK